MAINKTFSVLTAVVRILEYRDTGERTINLAGNVSFPRGGRDARVFLTYYNDESREPHINFSAVEPEDPLFCVVQGRAVSADSVESIPSFTKHLFPDFDLYIDADWVVPLFLTPDMYLNPHADCRLLGCGVCTHADDKALTFILKITQFAHLSGKDGSISVRCTIPRTKRFPEKVRHKFIPYPNSLAIVWGEVKDFQPAGYGSNAHPVWDITVESVIFFGKAESGTGSSSTPVTPSKIRSEPDSPDSPDSPMSKMEAKRRKLVTERTQQTPTQSSTSASTMRTRSRKGKEVATDQGTSGESKEEAMSGEDGD